MTVEEEAKWREDRLGRITASQFAPILVGMSKGASWGRGAVTYAVQLVKERIFREDTDGFQGNADTDHGKLYEPYAREEYERVTFNKVHPCGLILRQGTQIGATPDGLIGEDGGLEIKCPRKRHIHLATVIDGIVPLAHIPQIQGGLYVTGRKWWDFVSFHPDFPDHNRLFIKRVYRDEQFISAMALRLADFSNYVDDLEKKANEGSRKID